MAASGAMVIHMTGDNTDSPTSPFAGVAVRDQAVAETLALLLTPSSREELLAELKLQGVRNGSAFYTSNDLDKARTRLTRAGLLQGTRERVGRHSIALAGGVEHQILLHLKSTKRLEQRTTRFWKTPRGLYDTESRLRRAIHGLYLGNCEDLHHLLMDDFNGLQLTDILDANTPTGVFALLDAELQSLYARQALARAICSVRQLSPSELSVCQQSAARDDEHAAGLSDYHVLRGENSLAQELVATPSSPSTTASLAFIRLAEGDSEHARALTCEALQLSRGAKGRKRPSLTTHNAPFLIFALLNGNPEDAALARECLKSTKRRGSNTPLAGATAELVSLCESGSGRMTKATIEDALFGPIDWTAALFIGLRALWLSPTKKHEPRIWAPLVKAHKSLESNGFAWAAPEVDSVYQRLVNGRAGNKRVRLARLRQDRAPWERALHALSVVALGAQPVEGGSGPSKDRLVFVVRIDRTGALEVQARKQRALKKQGFSSGQDLSPGHLAKQGHKFTFLSAADRKVLACISTERIYGSTAHEYNEDVANALIGHPCVFFERDMNTPLEVVLGEPTMRLDKLSNGFRLSVYPHIRGRRVFCEAHGQRLVVYVATEKQREIDALLAKGMDFPKAADGELRRTVAQLTPLMPLESEIAIAPSSGEQVDATSCVALLLWRAAGGLRVRPVACPLGIGGPALVPGEGHAGLTARIGGQLMSCHRNLKAESDSLAQLLANCPALRQAPVEGQDYLVDGLTQCLELLDQLRALDEQLVMHWPDGQPISVVGARGVQDLRLRFKSAAQWIAADAELDVTGDEVLRIADLLTKLRASNGRFIDVGEGRFLALSSELRSRLSDLAGVVQPVKNGRHGLHPLALGMLSGWVGDVASVKTDKAVEERLALVREAHQLRVKVPRTLQAQLRDYQEDGVCWMQRLAHFGAGACLADDMGLGKTVQTLAVLLLRADSGPALVVAPTSVCQTWLDEASRFAPTLRTQRVTGPATDEAIEGAEAGDLLVVSYAVLVTRADSLKKKRFRTVVLDEAQAIKNASTQRARAAAELLADFRIATTGTPVENHLGELWSIMSFLNPGLLGSSKQFTERYGRPIQRDDDRAALASLRSLVAPFVLRRQKSEVLRELPAITEVVRYVEADDRERIFYKALRMQALARVQERDDEEGTPGQSHIHMLAELTRLRRAACHPELVGDETGIPSSKLEAVLDVVSDLRASNHRALIFSQFVGFLDIVKAALDERQVSYQYLDGKTPEKRRAQNVKAFQAGQGDVFLISLKAGGFGLNLTAADYVLHLDPWWNPAVERQASDRAHRIGQTRPVTVYRFVRRDSIEEQVLELHAGKRELANRLLEGSERMTSLDLSTLRALIAGDTPTASDSAPSS